MKSHSTEGGVDRNWKKIGKVEGSSYRLKEKPKEQGWGWGTLEEGVGILRPGAGTE